MFKSILLLFTSFRKRWDKNYGVPERLVYDF